MIINEDELLEDVIDGISNYLERPLTKEELVIAKEELETIMSEMFEMESEIIWQIAKRMDDESN